MKLNVLVMSVVSAVLFGGLLMGLFVYLWVTPAGEFERVSSGPSVAAAPPVEPDREVETLQAQLAMVSHRLGQLEEQLDQLSSASARRSVLPLEASNASTDGTEAAAAIGLTADDREAVVEILASVRAEEQRLRSEERLAREEERAAERAAEIAKELGLSHADEVALGDHLVAAAEKRNELMTQMREGNLDRTAIGEGFMEQREWSNEQLEILFGESLAGQIQQLERDNRGGFRGFGGRGGTEGQGVTTSQGRRGGG